MRKLALLAVTMTFALVGCNKKEAKLPPESTPGPSSGAPSSKDGQNRGNKGGGSGSENVGVVPAGGVGVVTNPSAVAGGGGGGGATQAVRKAVTRTVSENDMKQIHTFIETFSSGIGKMPQAQETYQVLQKEAPKIAELVKDGSIVLMMAKTREEIWAYEAAALENGGWAVSSSGVERMEAATLKQKLGVK